MGITTPDAESKYFFGFFASTFQYNGKNYINNLLSIQAPYTPSRTAYSGYLLQANDPMVHYLASDLNSQYGASAVWANKNTFLNGYWRHVDDMQSASWPIPPATPIGGRYQRGEPRDKWRA